MRAYVYVYACMRVCLCVCVAMRACVYVCVCASVYHIHVGAGRKPREQFQLILESTSGGDKKSKNSQNFRPFASIILGNIEIGVNPGNVLISLT